jgi:hypothetical protein
VRIAVIWVQARADLLAVEYENWQNIPTTFQGNLDRLDKCCVVVQPEIPSKNKNTSFHHALIHWSAFK